MEDILKKLEDKIYREQPMTIGGLWDLVVGEGWELSKMYMKTLSYDFFGVKILVTNHKYKISEWLPTKKEFFIFMNHPNGKKRYSKGGIDALR